MKTFLKILSVCLISVQTFAGPGASGGGMTPIISLTCQDRTVVTLDNWMHKGRASFHVWVQSLGNEAKYIPVQFLEKQSGLRILKLLDRHPYCSRSLVEISDSNWDLVSACGGLKRVVNCRKR